MKRYCPLDGLAVHRCFAAPIGLVNRMLGTSAFVFALTFAVVTLSASVARAEVNSSWPQWRGDGQTGTATGKTYPIQWSEQENVAWKTEIPGLGGSTPVTFADTAYVTTGHDGKNLMLAIDSQTGDIKWQVAIGDDVGKKHKKGGGSNPSPITDGKLIYAFFRSGDLGCVDLNGNLKWQTKISYDMKEGLWWDLGTSPILTDNAVVLTVMVSGPSYLVAFDKQTGKQLWKGDRTVDAPREAAQSYATPLNVTVDGEPAIAVMGGDYLTVHRADNGKELSRLGGFNPTAHEYFRSIASPVAQGNIIVCPYARGATVTGVRLDDLAAGKGKDAIAWFRDDVGSDVPTPAASNGRVFFISDGKQTRGRVTCLDAQTGETLWETSLPKSRIGFSSSPLIAGDHLYITSENATTYVLGPLASDRPELVATNQVDDDTQFTVASPTPTGDDLLLRTRHFLYKINSP